MKIINLILGLGLMALPFYSCNSQQPKEKTTGNKTTEVSPPVTLEHLTALTFKQKVFNYEVNKEWKFLGKKPAIIDFYADWCGPCRKVAPIVAQVAEQYKGKVDVYKINVDNEKELATAFGINGIPAILFIPMNEQPQMSTGVIAKEEFDRVIKEVFKVN
jgi:thioredoxin